MRPSKSSANAINRAVAIQDWVASDATELTLKKGDEVKIYRYMANGWVEAGHIMGLRGMCPQSYLREIGNDGASYSGGAPKTTVASSDITATADSGKVAPSPTPQKPSVGIEKFQLTSLEAFDQLMDQGYAVEVKEMDESDGDGRLPVKGDQVEVELVGMMWDASQTVVTEFVRGDDIGTPCMLTVGEEQMTQGLDLALMSLAVGARAMVVVAPPLAYKEIGEPRYGIPASVHVVFDVRVVTIVPSTESATKQGRTTVTGAAQGAGQSLQPRIPTLDTGASPTKDKNSARDSIGSRVHHVRTSSKGGMSLERKSMSPNSLAMQRGRHGRLKLDEGSGLGDRVGPEVDLHNLSDSELLDRAAAMMGIEGNGGSGAWALAATTSKPNDPRPSKPSSKPPVPSQLDKLGSDCERTYTLDELLSIRRGSTEAYKDLDRSHLEVYLSADDFASTFGMRKDAFKNLPGWKQKKLKQDVQLF